MAKYLVGIDLHKTVVQVCVLDAQGEVFEVWRSALPDSPAGHALVARLAAHDGPCRLAVEALGCNRWFVDSCRAAGPDVLVVHAGALALKNY